MTWGHWAEWGLNFYCAFPLCGQHGGWWALMQGCLARRVKPSLWRSFEANGTIWWAAQQQPRTRVSIWAEWEWGLMNTVQMCWWETRERDIERAMEEGGGKGNGREISPYGVWTTVDGPQQALNVCSSWTAVSVARHVRPHHTHTWQIAVHTTGSHHDYADTWVSQRRLLARWKNLNLHLGFSLLQLYLYLFDFFLTAWKSITLYIVYMLWEHTL